MIDKEYFECEIEDILNENHSLSRGQLDELYNLLCIKGMLYNNSQSKGSMTMS